MTSKVGKTVTEHILLSQKAHTEATGEFTRLLSELIVAAKLIHREVNKAGLVDILGYAGSINVQGEMVQKLDEYANHTIINRMQHLGLLCGMVSEENADIIKIRDEYPKGKYILIFDPLDGSSNINANVNIGTIFSILKKKSDSEECLESDVLRPGYEQVAAGYFIYGSSTVMVYTTGDGVYGFTLFPSIGEFLLSHERIQIPKRGKIFSVNMGYYHYWDDKVKKVVNYFQTPDKATKRPYSLRYIGSLVADFHRNLLYGGLFMYPADKKDPAKPTGKLRLLCEANPLAFIIEQAGGAATTGTQRILDVQPESLHQRVPLFIGSPEDVAIVEKIMNGKEG